MVARTTIAILAVAVGLAALLAREAGAFLAPAAPRIDARYAAAREALRGQATVGFITDQDLKTDAGALRYHAAAYALAPTLFGPGQTLVLVDVARSSAIEELAFANHLRVLRRLGPDLAILQP